MEHSDLGYQRGYPSRYDLLSSMFTYIQYLYAYSYIQKHVYDSQKGKLGDIVHFIVTPEQLFVDPKNGHMSLFGQTLLTNRTFQRSITDVFVDECHSIHVAGLGSNGLPPFRPCWGRLDEIKTQLPRSVCWHGMTATLPPHMFKTVSEKILHQGFRSTRATSNRKNITLATHQVVGSLEQLRNYRCFLTMPYNHATQPRVLLFFDDKTLAMKVAKYLQGLLPSATPEEKNRHAGVVCYYHSDMSLSYLEEKHVAFNSVPSQCRIMCATSGLSLVSADLMFSPFYLTRAFRVSTLPASTSSAMWEYPQAW